MSLLLDARKKSQQQTDSLLGESGATAGLSLEPIADSAPPYAEAVSEQERRAGQNLFDAKIPSSLSRPAINHNLLYALGGSAILLAIGGSYVWYTVVSSDSNPQLLRPAPAAISEDSTETRSPQNMAPALKTITNQPTVISVATGNAGPARPAPATRAHRTMPGHLPPLAPPQPSPASLHHNPQPVTSLDTVLNNAYQSYRHGKLDEAQQLYLGALGNDPQNSDALLGLAVIAQQRGDNKTAGQYYARVLNLDPRNAVANAGMSAISADSNRESRLKTLLREQDNSAALHLALGNLYAEQSRWSEAQQAYFDAYALDTQNANLAFNLAVSLEHLGQNKLAAEHYQRAVQLDTPHIAGFDHAQITQRINELTH
jgi:tetratricopeptide (TPR) repeat protein